MAAETQYIDPIATKLIEKFEQYGFKELKGKYYYGTPMIIAQNQLNFRRSASVVALIVARRLNQTAMTDHASGIRSPS